MSRSNKRLIIGIAALLLLILSWGRFIYIDGPYKGKIVDMETKKPLGGTAVVAVWWQDSFGAAHTIESVYEAKESLTDQEGNFRVPTLWMVSINPLSIIREPVFYIFKPGYAAYGGWSINPVALGEDIRVRKTWWRRTVELRRLRTRDERLNNMSSALPLVCDPTDTSRFCVPSQKIPQLINLHCNESVDLGLRRSPC